MGRVMGMLRSMWTHQLLPVGASMLLNPANAMQNTNPGWGLMRRGSPVILRGASITFSGRAPGTLAAWALLGTRLGWDP